MYASINFLLSFDFFFPLWCRHVFKRLRFLGNKLVSQMFTLLFLAIWHGLHSGYLICFSLEFLIVNVEKQVTMATVPYQTYEAWKCFESRWLKSLSHLLLCQPKADLKVYRFEDVWRFWVKPLTENLFEIIVLLFNQRWSATNCVIESRKINCKAVN